MKRVTIILSALAIFAACGQKNKQAETANNETEHAEYNANDDNLSEQISSDDHFFEAVSPTILITDAGAGIFQFGKPIPFDNSDYVFVKDTFYFDGNEWITFTVYENDKELLRIWPDNNEIYDNNKYINKISSLIFLSNKFVTAEGIGVGSTIEEFFRAYPNSTLRYSNYNYDYTLLSADCEIVCFLSEEDLLINVFEEYGDFGDAVELKISDFKKGTKIRQIRIFEKR